MIPLAMLASRGYPHPVRIPLACALTIVSSFAQATPAMAPSPGGPVFVGPTSPHVSSLIWNPAASGLMQGHHVLLLGTASLDATSIQRATISSTDGEPSPSGDRSFPGQNPLYVTPGAIVGFVSDLGTTDFTLGVAGVLAFADRVPDLDDSLGYHATGESIYGQSTIFSISYRATSKIYLGLGVSLLFSKIRLGFLRDRALDSCTTHECGVETAAATERWNVESDWDSVPGISFAPVVSANGGALVRLFGWWLGVSVIFPAGTSGTVGKDARVSVVPAGGGEPIVADARATFNVPWFVHVGARRTIFGGLELLVNGSYARLGLQQGIDLRILGRAAREAGLPEWLVRHRGLDDVYTVEVGLEQAPARSLRLGARVRFQTGAVSAAEVAPHVIDAPTLGLAGGLELRATRRLGIVAGYALGLRLPIDVDASAYSPGAAIDCNASGFDLSSPACLAARQGRASPTAAGRYTRISNELSLGLTYDIW